MGNPEQFIHKAKKLAARSFNMKRRQSIAMGESEELKPEELYVVWFSKTLGNWKALVSTDKLKGVYFEVTYNGAKQETYVDEYRKIFNTRLKDETTQSDLALTI